MIPRCTVVVVLLLVVESPTGATHGPATGKDRATWGSYDRERLEKLVMDWHTRMHQMVNLMLFYRAYIISSQNNSDERYAITSYCM